MRSFNSLVRFPIWSLLPKHPLSPDFWFPVSWPIFPDDQSISVFKNTKSVLCQVSSYLVSSRSQSSASRKCTFRCLGRRSRAASSPAGTGRPGDPRPRKTLRASLPCSSTCPTRRCRERNTRARGSPLVEIDLR